MANASNYPIVAGVLTPAALCAVKIVQYSLQKITRLKWISPSPILVIQPEMDLAGGLSEIEHRAFLEMGESAGARRTVVHYGRLLSNDDAAALAEGSQ